METNVKSWDKLINALYAVFLVGLLVIAGLDAIRFRWSDMPVGLQVVGLLGLLSAGGVIWWTVAENTFASRWARI